MSAVARTTTTPARTSSGTSQPASFGSLPTAGSSIIVMVYGSIGGSVGTPTCSDNQGVSNTYTRDKIQQNVAGGAFVTVFRCHNIGATSGTFTVTPQGFPAGSEIETVATEVTGLLNVAPDTSNSNSSTTGAPSTGSITTTNAAGDYIVAVMSLETASNPATVTTPTNYTSRQKETNGASFEVGDACDRVTTATVSGENPTWNSNTVHWAACVVAYKNAAATLGSTGAAAVPTVGRVPMAGGRLVLARGWGSGGGAGVGYTNRRRRVICSGT